MRPVGFIAVICILLVLAWRQRWRTVCSAVLLGIGMTAMYFWPVWKITGDPLISFRLYAGDDWKGSIPLTWPFHLLISEPFTTIRHERWTHTAISLIWSAVTMVCAVLLCRRRVAMNFLRGFPVEALFCYSYLAFFLCYDAEGVGLRMAQYILPILPIILFIVRDSLPQKRSLLWGMAAISSVMASCSAIGFKGVFGFALR